MYESVNGAIPVGPPIDSNGLAQQVRGGPAMKVSRKKIMTVEDLAPRLCAAHNVAPLPGQRPCLVFRGLLDPEECAAINTANADAWIENQNLRSGPDAVGARSQFGKHDPDLSAKIWSRIRSHLPEHLDGGVALGLRASWNHARYCPGQWVFAHMDQRMNSEENANDPTVGSRITITIYLDDTYEGAEFVFVKGVKLDGSYEEEHYRPAPGVGDAVLFYQSVDEFAHAVLPLQSGTKTIMRSDVLYQFDTIKDADIGGERVVQLVPGSEELRTPSL